MVLNPVAGHLLASDSRIPFPWEINGVARVQADVLNGSATKGVMSPVKPVYEDQFSKALMRVRSRVQGLARH